jgi:hypothetical protein
LLRFPTIPEVIQSNQTEYSHPATTLETKREIVNGIIQIMQMDGHSFLKRESGLHRDGWVQLSEEEARQKVAHALQYRRRCSMRLQQCQDPATYDAPTPVSIESMPQPCMVRSDDSLAAPGHDIRLNASQPAGATFRSHEEPAHCSLSVGIKQSDGSAFDNDRRYSLGRDDDPLEVDSLQSIHSWVDDCSNLNKADMGMVKELPYADSFILCNAARVVSHSRSRATMK